MNYTRKLPRCYTKSTRNSHENYPGITRKLFRSYTKITQKLPENYPDDTQKLHRSYPKITQKLSGNYPELTRKLPRSYTKITQKLPAKHLYNNKQSIQGSLPTEIKFLTDLSTPIIFTCVLAHAHMADRHKFMN